MLFRLLPYLIFALLSLATFAYACRPSVWAVGLGKNQTTENHLRIVGHPISIQEHRSEINGHTASIEDDDKTTIKAIRSDESVGFVTKVHQDYFRKFDLLIEAGWDGDDRDLYEHMLHPDFQWYRLQYRDSEIINTAGMRRSISFNSRCHEAKSDKTSQKSPSGMGTQIGRGL
jgi:hypothetical protein